MKYAIMYLHKYKAREERSFCNKHETERQKNGKNK